MNTVRVKYYRLLKNINVNCKMNVTADSALEQF
jgi:hypothetical protein